MLVLMQSPDGGQMNVPVEKLAQFLDDGWKEISRQAQIVPAPLDVETAASPAHLPPGAGGKAIKKK